MSFMKRLQRIRNIVFEGVPCANCGTPNPNNAPACHSCGMKF